jgi:hypothetical protein
MEDADLEEVETREAMPVISAAQKAKPFQFFRHTCVFLIVTILAVLSISELAARDSIAALIKSRESELTSRLARNATASPTPSPTAAGAVVSYDPVSLIELSRLELLATRLQELNALGAKNEKDELWSIAQAVYPPHGETATNGPTLNQFVGVILESLTFIPRASSDLLLALTVVACGAVGSMIASFRQFNSVTPRSFVLGVSSGFIAYLAIKGGRHVFLLQTSGDPIVFNPYGSAFAALLTGLFTERAYELLSTIVDDFSKRVRAAATPSPDRVRKSG